MAIESNYLALSKKERLVVAEALVAKERIIQDCLVKHRHDKSHGDLIEALVRMSNMSGYIEFHEEKGIHRPPPDYVVESYDETIKALSK